MWFAIRFKTVYIRSLTQTKHVLVYSYFMAIISKSCDILVLRVLNRVQNVTIPASDLYTLSKGFIAYNITTLYLYTYQLRISQLSGEIIRLCRCQLCTYQLDNYCLSDKIRRYIPLIQMSALYLYTNQLENDWLSDEIILYIPVIPMSALHLYTYQLEKYCLSDEIIRYIPIITMSAVY